METDRIDELERALCRAGRISEDTLASRIQEIGFSVCDAGSAAVERTTAS